MHGLIIWQNLLTAMWFFSLSHFILTGHLPHGKIQGAMIHLLKDRNSSLGEIDMSSFANIALSNRLTEDPMRFFKSGYQTVEDIIKLASDISNGKHPVIPGTRNINIFAYSIGAFLAEIIIMGNPDNLFSEIKLFIFCGGSVFSNMKGSSKLIMDKRAFDRVYNYYLNDFEKTITGKSPLVDFSAFKPDWYGIQIDD